MISLRPDVLEVTEDVDVAPRLDLPQHRVQHDVAAGPANTGAEKNRLIELAHRIECFFHFCLDFNFFWCALFGYLYFLFFSLLNQPVLGSRIVHGMFEEDLFIM